MKAGVVFVGACAVVYARRLPWLHAPGARKEVWKLRKDTDKSLTKECNRAEAYDTEAPADTAAPSTMADAPPKWLKDLVADAKASGVDFVMPLVKIASGYKMEAIIFGNSGTCKLLMNFENTWGSTLTHEVDITQGPATANPNPHHREALVATAFLTDKYKRLEDQYFESLFAGGTLSKRLEDQYFESLFAGGTLLVTNTEGHGWHYTFSRKTEELSLRFAWYMGPGHDVATSKGAEVKMEKWPSSEQWVAAYMQDT